MSKFARDDDGNVIDPPILPDWEAKAEAARNSGDPDQMEYVQEQYSKARDEEVSRLEEADKSRQAAQDEADARRRAEQEQAAADAKARADAEAEAARVESQRQAELAAGGGSQ